MPSPFPLKVYPSSGLTFAWKEMHEKDGIHSSFDGALGPDGVVFTMVMRINWNDLAVALQQLLGYSWRDTSTSPSTLRRNLPWQHPFTNQLWVKSISSIKGVQLNGIGVNIAQLMGGAGAGFQPNAGPWSTFVYADLVLHFWRPPYYVRTDQDVQINGPNGVFQAEWLRYCDKGWQDDVQILSREGSQYLFSPGQGLNGKYFQGSVGQKLMRSKVRRTWYQIPEAALFASNADKTPQGEPTNLLLTQTATTNPITGYVYPAGSPIGGCVNSPLGGGTDDTDATKRFFGAPIGTLLYEVAEYKPHPLQMPAYLMRIPGLGGQGLEPLSQVQYDVTLHFDRFDPPRITTAGYVGAVVVGAIGGGYSAVNPPTIQFSGGGGSGATATAVINPINGSVFAIVLTNAGSGYTSAPSVTINGGGGAGATADAVFVPPSSALPANWRGHNLMPFSGNGFWYAVQCQQGPVTTPFQYADFSNLFQIL